MKMGPKDWMPTVFRQPGDVYGMTPQDVERLKRIDSSFRYGHQASSKDAEDILWLCNMAGQLARWKFDDFDFPKHVGLVNQIMCRAWAMRYEKKIRVEAVHTVGPAADSIRLLEWTADTKQLEAVLVVRPVLYLPRDLPKASRRLFEGARLRMTADSIDLISAAPVEEFICPETETLPRKRPFVFRHLDVTLLSANFFDEKKQEVLIEPLYGVFIGNLTPVTVLLENLSLKKPVEVRLKLVAAQYLSVERSLDINAPKSPE